MTNKKHVHSELIKQWLEDTSQEILHLSSYSAKISNINYLVDDIDGQCEFILKPKPDEYEHLRKSAKEGNQLSELQNNGEWKLIDKKYNHIIPDFFDGRPARYFKVVDEYEHLRQAIRDGKKIEVFKNNGKWVIAEYSLLFNEPVNYYRIHDPYRELKEAKEQGKRIVWQDSKGDWEDLPYDASYKFDKTNMPPERYKVVENDEIKTFSEIWNVFNEHKRIDVKFTKSGIDGTIKAEVIND